MFDPKTIFLVVDDFEPMRKVTMNQLRSIGAAQVLTAVDGVEALRLLKSRRVDMVLSDWNMPHMSGLELLKAMRADPKLERVPFIMITAEAERQQIQEAIQNGVTNLLLKPYTPARLAQHIDKAFTQQVRRRPMEMAQSSPPQAPSSAIQPTKKTAELPLILIVDDAPDNLMLLSHIFKGEYQVRLAQNGRKALTLCQSDNPPDLVLLDVMMPDMDGFEVIARMREHPVSENIPVIFVTALGDDEARAKGMGLGAVDYVSKPVDPDTLKLRVRNFLRYVNAHKQLQASYDDMLEIARLRDDVEHMARHDLKGPLAGVIGILQEVIGEKCEHANELKLAEQTLFQVLGMINLSAEVLKIEMERFVLHAAPLDLGDLLRRVAETNRAAFLDKRLSIGLELPSDSTLTGSCQVLGDATLCYSIFQNLLKNACEAAPAGTRVDIRLTNSEKMTHVSIQNTGAVPASIRNRFFEKYTTLGKASGTGLGTYSALLLTQAQHGTIELAVSDADNRTCVTVDLPRSAATP